MTDQAQDDPAQGKALALGVYDRRVSSSGLSAAETIALVLTVLWLAGVTVFFFVMGRAADAGSTRCAPSCFVRGVHAGRAVLGRGARRELGPRDAEPRRRGYRPPSTRCGRPTSPRARRRTWGCAPPPSNASSTRSWRRRAGRAPKAPSPAFASIREERPRRAAPAARPRGAAELRARRDARTLGRVTIDDFIRAQLPRNGGGPRRLPRAAPRHAGPPRGRTDHGKPGHPDPPEPGGDLHGRPRRPTGRGPRSGGASPKASAASPSRRWAASATGPALR
jgi:hypothetical protein